MLSSDELITKIKLYSPEVDDKLILKAYNFGKEYHKNQKRHSGEPYFTHPLSVAQILIDLKLDQDSIIAALLHDVVEDTEANLEDIEQNFGKEVAELVDGVTKLGQINSIPVSERVAENFRKLTIAMSKDIRVLLIKLADRYHNMQTISYLKSSEKKIIKAQESIDIYAPLAGRIGLNKIKDELYDIAFEIIDPESRALIKKNLSQIDKENKGLVDRIVADLKDLLQKNDVKCEIFGRQKTPYSIWNKMKRRNIGFSNLHDVMAFRIVTENISECYKALGIINSNYSMIPKTFKDYISTPKSNGYKSIHLATIGPHNQKIELQIRDKEMHEIAEFGLAAHWRYKESGSKRIETKNLKENDQYRWIRDLISLFENSHTSSEVLKEQKLNFHQDEVFCFTPNGDIFSLPIGSCLIDFAYAIHSEVGDSCSAAKVNGIISPLRSLINNGDQIEIITSKNAKPSPNWLNYVVTSKAKSAIRCFVRNQKYNEYKTLGQAIINKFYISKKIKFDEKLIAKVAPKFNKKTIEDLYVAVAQGIISRYDLLKATNPEFKEKESAKTKNDKLHLNENKNNDDYNLPIDGLVNGMSIHYGGCCNPIPGDLITGVINTGSGVTIHHRECKTLSSMSIIPQRIIDVCWKSDNKYENNNYVVKIRAVMINKSGSLAEITNILARKKVNINNIKIVNRASDFFELMISIEIKNSQHLNDIISTLRISNKVQQVERVN